MVDNNPTYDIVNDGNDENVFTSLDRTNEENVNEYIFIYFYLF
jgi:hypothetical protein